MSELDRIRTEYGAREERLSGSDLYSPFNPAHLFLMQERERVTLKLLRRSGFYPLGTKRLLEIGCGKGSILTEYLRYGASPEGTFGADLLMHRLREGQRQLPHIGLTCSDAQSLPFASQSFDLVLQYTVFSSILDANVKANVAKEMLRVVRQHGAIVWYDFWLNPVNPQTKGIRRKEINRLFPYCKIINCTVSLAPPITRRLVGISWLMCAILERLRLLNTHHLMIIQPL